MFSKVMSLIENFTRNSLVFLLTLSFNAVLVSADDSFQLLQRGQQQLQMGQVDQALKTLKESYQQVKYDRSETGKKRQARVMRVLGEANVRSQKFTCAKDWLDKSYTLAKTLSAPYLLSEISQIRGVLYTTQNRLEEALYWYAKALAYAKQSSDDALISSSYISYTNALTHVKQSSDHLLIANSHINVSEQSPQQTADNLNQAYLLTQQLDNIRIKRKQLLKIGYQAKQAKLTILADKALKEVLSLTPESRQKAEASGYLGSLYMQQGRNSEALDWTQRAIIADKSPDLLLKWEQLQAELLRKKGEKQQAINAYRRAIIHINSIRRDLPIFHQNGTSSFKEILSPIYQGLVDLLLQQSDNHSEQSAKNLKEVQERWEDFKSAELNDYFRSYCATRQSELTDWQSDEKKDAAILYPIILDDRLELLLIINQKIRHYTVNIKREDLIGTINDFTDYIHNTINALRESQDLPKGNRKRLESFYDWLIKPIASELNAHHGITTIIYIPDGALRKVPLGVLYDSEKKQYLIQKYAIVTNPGLSMLSLKERQKNIKRVLLAGLSELGPAIDELPCNDNELTPLTEVKNELKDISLIFDKPNVLNEDFTLKTFKQLVLKGPDIIHLASHGRFSANPKQSFLMTYDHLLNMNHLVSLFQTEAFTNSPIDLISFSACYTAEGNDRSPLGLSGVVVQAGVHSALGSLWPALNDAPNELFKNFYLYYSQKKMAKAKAFQQAQLDLLKQPAYRKPVFWGGFILVGNWN